jgi:thiol-disulfide isomerase/thioredoxin
MTFASLLLALLTATNSPASDASDGPALLDFHAEWCGPCHKARPAVAQLIRQGYPIKTIDIDQEPKLQARYHVKQVPTFIVVDGAGRELDRTTGPQPAADLAKFYKAAIAKVQPPASSDAHVGSREDSRGNADDGEDPPDSSRKSARNDDNDRPESEGDAAEPPFTNPKPWESVVRIRVLGNRSTGFGSGTIIHSTPQESIILTCAHIFKIEGRKQVQPSEFQRKIMIDLFDGTLRGPKKNMVHFVEQVEGRAVDYDFNRDVGLIRIRPGRRLPACRIVPDYWQPKSRMAVLTVGCSEGHDATAWNTVISRPRIQNFLSGNPTYEAIECNEAPKQGRSGGGLFTEDGYVAGVCNFAEPQGNHGLYATPRSIYHILDRNNMMAFYSPVSRGSGTVVADGRAGSQPRRNVPVAVERGQSPDHEEAPRNRTDGEIVKVPSPNFLGIVDPVAESAERTARAASGTTTRRTAWQPHPVPGAPASVKTKAEPTDLNLDPSADHDHFGPPSGDAQTQEGTGDQADSKPATLQGATSGSRWRPVKAKPALEAAPTAER